jgi:hypothetical protein
MYERAVELVGPDEARRGAYAVLKSDKGVIQLVPFKRAIAFKPWMNNCQLIIIGEVKDYNNNTIQTFSNILQQRLAIRRR